MAGVSDEEIARLANRLAMLVSDDGEADNAGRAVGALARRLGLSGGQLKAIFMAGAELAGAQTVRLASQANKIRVLEGHAELLREALAGAEAVGRQHARERDALREEVASLRAALGARRQRRRVGWMAVLAMLVVAGGLGGVGYSLPWLYGALHTAPSGGAPVYHTAQVRDRASVLRQQPDPAAPEVSTLPVGARLTVRRVLWHNLMQWVEVDFDGKSGFVLSTDVDLSQRETPLDFGLALRVDARAHPERGRPWGARRAPRSHAPRSLRRRRTRDHGEEDRRLHQAANSGRQGQPVAAGGPALGQRGLNIMAFVKEFNAVDRADGAGHAGARW